MNESAPTAEQNEAAPVGALRVLSLPTHARPRIVSLLEDLLARAKEGKVTGLFVIAEDEYSNVEHSRDGMSDCNVVWNIELIKKRVLGEYR